MRRHTLNTVGLYQQ